MWGTVPDGATTGPISIETSIGTAISTTDFVVTTGPIPKITGFSTSSGLEGSDLRIQGEGLVDIISISFNGAATTSWMGGSAEILVSVVSSFYRLFRKP